MVARAVIVEPREHAALEAVVQNIARASGLPVTIVHGTQNGAFARGIADRCPQVDVLAEMNAENLDIRSYNKLWLHPSIWTNVGPGDKILKFEVDAGACGEPAGLQAALEYDYCGAPWFLPKGRDFILVVLFIVFLIGALGGFISATTTASLSLRGKYQSPGGMATSLGVTVASTIVLGLISSKSQWGGMFQVGNGGLSVRDVATSLRYAKEYVSNGGYPVDRYVPDDVAFSNACYDDPDCAVCPASVALKFSEDSLKSSGAWGFHKNWTIIKRPLCRFNTEVRDMYKAPYSGVRYPVPTADWEPVVRVVWRRV
jgi:hypothetical protein